MNRFISLYDKAPCFSLIGKSIEEKYEALGIEDKNVLYTHKVDDALIGYYRALCSVGLGK